MPKLNKVTNNSKRSSLNNYIISGMILFTVSFVVMIFNLLHTYDVGNKCITTDDRVCSSLGVASLIGRLSIYGLYAGLILSIIGIYSNYRSKRK